MGKWWEVQSKKTWLGGRLIRPGRASPLRGRPPGVNGEWIAQHAWPRRATTNSDQLAEPCGRYPAYLLVPSNPINSPPLSPRLSPPLSVDGRRRPDEIWQVIRVKINLPLGFRNPPSNFLCGPQLASTPVKSSDLQQLTVVCIKVWPHSGDPYWPKICPSATRITVPQDGPSDGKRTRYPKGPRWCQTQRVHSIQAMIVR